MVLQWLIQNSEKYAFRKRDEAQKARVSTAAALLTSLIADADVVTDWLYFSEIISRDDNGEEGMAIPSWIRLLQLVSCICGTLSWLAISSDGRLMDWLRQATWWMAWGCWWVIAIIFYWIPRIFTILISCRRIDIKYDGCYGFDIYDYMLNRAKDNLNAFFSGGFRISSGGLLMAGILTEDLPQILMTFIIEDAINDENGISRSAYLNLVVAIFDILHKLASAWDDRKLYIPTGTGIRTFLGHTNWVRSLAAVGLDRIVSASEDGTARLWDIATGKTVQTFNLREWGWDGSIVKLGSNRILTTSWNSDGKMKVFNIETGECLKTIDNGWNAPKCTAVSNSGEYFLTSKPASNEIIRWDAFTLEQKQTYPRKADSLVMLNDTQFVSANETEREEGYPVLWDIATGNTIRTFNIQESNSYVTAMSKRSNDSFLVASVHGHNTCINMFAVGQSNPVETMTIEGYEVYRLTSVDDNRFIASEFVSAVLWDISTGSRLHTFDGHTRYIMDILYLPQQGAIATASWDHTVKVWPVPANHHDDNADTAGGNDNDDNSPNSADIENQGS